MKKILSLILSLLMVAALSVPIFADGTPTISFESATIEAGQTVELSCLIENNPGVAGLNVQLAYDKSVIEIGKIVKGSSDFGTVQKGTVTAGNKFTWANAENDDTDGVYFTVPVTVKEGTPGGDYPITVTAVQIKDEDLNTITDQFVCVSSVITVPRGTPTVTFTANSVTVDETNVESFRKEDGSFIVPVPVTASGIPADCGMAAFNVTFASDAEIDSVLPGSAISNTDMFQVGPDKMNIWVDTNEITAADAEIAVVNLKVPHAVTAGSTFNVTITASDDPDDFLLIDASVYNAAVAAGTVNFTVGGHAADEAVRENENGATCTVNGSYDEVTYCKYCGVELSRTPKTIEAPGHTMTHFDRVEATTEADGNVEYWFCSVCSKYFSDAEGNTEIAQADTVIPKIVIPAVKGDVDGDGKVNAQDVIAIMRYLVGWRDVTIDLELADYNSDGKLNNRDVYMILKDIVNGVLAG